MKNNESFIYTYSAKEQEEIKKIREKYLPKEPNNMERLRRRDKSVTNKSTIASLVAGIIGTLIMGIGMCCCLVWTDYFVAGIIIGAVGIVVLSIAYPLYSYITKKERERIAPEIIRLTDELMK